VRGRSLVPIERVDRHSRRWRVRVHQGLSATSPSVSRFKSSSRCSTFRIQPHTGSMESWQRPDREWRHKAAFRPMPDIIELGRCDQRRGGLRHKFVTPHPGHSIETILLQDVLLNVRRHITGRPEQPGRPCEIHDERASLKRFPDRCVACDHGEGIGSHDECDEDSVRERAVRGLNVWPAQSVSPHRDRPASLRGRLHGAVHGMC
jgi:hypothetical protein